MRKTISLVLATYNGEKYLREQLDSIYSQSMIPDEVIVCDDSSKDNTIAILQDYHEKYNLKYYSNSPALGVNGNFYKALSLTTGDYIAICDQDDIWQNNKIEVTYQRLSNIDTGSEPCVVSSLSDDIDGAGNVYNKAHERKDTYKYSDTLLYPLSSQGCTLMLNRQLLNIVLKHKDDCPDLNDLMYDGFISFTAAILGKKYNIGKSLMYYRHHTSNVIAKASVGRKSINEIIRQTPLLPGIMPDSRLYNLVLLKGLYKGYNMQDSIIILLKKSEELYYHNTWYTRVIFILSLTEFSLCSRIKYSIHAVVISILKQLVK